MLWVYWTSLGLVRTALFVSLGNTCSILEYLCLVRVSWTASRASTPFCDHSTSASSKTALTWCLEGHHILFSLGLFKRCVPKCEQSHVCNTDNTILLVNSKKNILTDIFHLCVQLSSNFQLHDQVNCSHIVTHTHSRILSKSEKTKIVRKNRLQFLLFSLLKIFQLFKANLFNNVAICYFPFSAKTQWVLGAKTI